MKSSATHKNDRCVRLLRMHVIINSTYFQDYDRHGVWPVPRVPSSQPRRNGSAFDEPVFHNAFDGDPFFDRSRRRQFPFMNPFDLFDSIFRDIHRDLNGGGRRESYQDPYNAFDSDPFLNRARRTQPPFMNPFDLSDSIFRDTYRDFNGGRPRELYQDPFSAFGTSLSPFGFGVNFQGGPGNTQMRSLTHQSLSFNNGQDSRWVSESHMARSINGVMEAVHERRDSNVCIWNCFHSSSQIVAG